VGDVVPIDQWSRVLPVIFFDTITPMRTYNSNPIYLRNCGSAEGGVRLSLILPLQRGDASFPVLAILDLNDENSAELDRGGNEPDNLDYEIRNVALAVLGDAALRSNDITLGSREQRGQN